MLGDWPLNGERFRRELTEHDVENRDQREGDRQMVCAIAGAQLPARRSA